MSTTAPPQQVTSDPAEAVPLAQEMHAALARLVGEYKRSLGVSTEEALAKATEALPGEGEHALKAPPERVTWYNLHFLAQRDPEAAARRWEEIKKAALDELRSGHRAARAFLDTSPWERAQFLALRDELARQWRPQGGVECQLIETMAQAQAGWLFWLKVMTMWATLGAAESGRGCENSLGLATPRLSTGEAIDRAGAMADRFNKIFLRTLRALQDLRRRTPAVVVQNVGQVNVGGQQCNGAGARATGGGGIGGRVPPGVVAVGEGAGQGSKPNGRDRHRHGAPCDGTDVPPA